jgi:uncharacterized membrane protein YtjA (UPF0391 family)
MFFGGASAGSKPGYYLFLLSGEWIVSIMKHSLLLFAALSFVTAVLGFSVLSGSAAIVFRILFMVAFIMTVLGLIPTRRAKKPVRGTFATSFQSEARGS